MWMWDWQSKTTCTCEMVSGVCQPSLPSSSGLTAKVFWATYENYGYSLKALWVVWESIRERNYRLRKRIIYLGLLIAWFLNLVFIIIVDSCYWYQMLFVAAIYIIYVHVERQAGMHTLCGTKLHAPVSSVDLSELPCTAPSESQPHPLKHASSLRKIK